MYFTLQFNIPDKTGTVKEQNSGNGDSCRKYFMFPVAEQLKRHTVFF